MASSLVSTTIPPSATSLPATVAKPAASAKPASKSKPRKRVNTAEKRHQHNAIERARRETLNGKFITLARLLPSLANARRPSKSAIVNGSISHLTYQREQRLLAAKLLRKLCADHDALLNEVNDWRTHNGYSAKENGPAWTDEMEEICSVEKETFGTFANYDDADADDDDIIESNDMASVDSDRRPMTGMSAEASLPTPHDNLSGAQAQAIFSSMPVMPQAQSLDWSRDFLGIGAQNTGMNHSSMSFNTLFPDQLDHSSSDSPANSQVGAMVMTPNTTDLNVFTQTPSPRSSQSQPMPAEELKPRIVPSSAPSVAPQGWAASQAMFFQQQQQQLHRLQEQQSQAHLLPAHQGFNPAAGHGPSAFPMNAFNNVNLAGAAAGNVNSLGQFNNQAFTQQLFASMFPNGSIPSSSHEQVQAWRKNAFTTMLSNAASGPNVQGHMLNGTNGAPSVDELRGAMRTGVGLGLGMCNVWSEAQAQQNAVEGF